ncbi:WD40-repeat-containing domain protein [Hygrophoropsis aurantiaca]|uniref:WD40-repeat-containing domain protein n=1 Tax=Hygrophoropsis aurantiaca TaxID=72124 RepID=A0ACB7ZYH9_9AGAM|nr:WD40-repeat-containing domain protein [Hygrophoropsis aurantiaca]
MPPKDSRTTLGSKILGGLSRIHTSRPATPIQQPINSDAPAITGDALSGAKTTGGALTAAPQIGATVSYSPTGPVIATPAASAYSNITLSDIDRGGLPVTSVQHSIDSGASALTTYPKVTLSGESSFLDPCHPINSSAHALTDGILSRAQATEGALTAVPRTGARSGAPTDRVIDVSAATYSKVTISGIKLRGSGISKKIRKIYIKVNIGDTTHEGSTKGRLGDLFEWHHETFIFDIFEISPALCIDVHTSRTLLEFKRGYVGGITATLESLLSEGHQNAVITRKLMNGNVQGLDVELELSLAVEHSMTAVAPAALQQADNNVQDMVTVDPPAVLSGIGDSIDNITSIVQDMVTVDPPAVLSGIGDSIDNITSIVQVWDPLLQKVKFVTDILDNVAEIHPYVKMAWSILSVIPKSIIAQVNRDDAICTLLQSLHDMYQCITEVEPLKWDDEVSLVFVRKRLSKGIFSDTDGQIKSYNAKILDLKNSLQKKIIVKSGICVMHILEEVKNLASAVDLNDIPYAHGAKYQREKMCLPGTRKDIIDEICVWINNQGDSVPRAMFLAGVAGSGKSAIAHTVAQIFDNLQRLGSSFFFDQSKATIFHPGVLFSTIARDLADLDPAFNAKLVQAIEKRADRSTPSIAEQFEKFIIRPTSELHIVGPVVIVIDALDESGDQIHRKRMLSVLSEKISSLPCNFRILITGRPESDIVQRLCPSKNLVVQNIDQISSSSVLNNDISFFIENSLSSSSDTLNREWENKGWVKLMTEKSNGLFQWAFTACEFINNRKAGQTVDGQFRKILQSPNSKGFAGLDSLYKTILENSLVIDDEDSMRNFKAVMRTVLAACEPLPASILQKLQPNIQLDDVISYLGSVLTGVTIGINSDCQMTVRPLHISFRDFLLDAKRAGQFHINITDHQQFMGLKCLQIMKSGLKFNICRLEDSHIYNKDVKDLSKRIDESISKDLSYACKYWMDHLKETSSVAQGVEDEIQDFLDKYLLWWLEVMVLSEDTISIMKVLRQLNQWANESAIQSLSDDAIQFVDVFGEAFTQCLPHLYLSALSLAPAESDAQEGQLLSWPSLRKAMQSSSGVETVAFSPDGKQIVSGSWGGIIHIWNAQTGSAVMKLSAGETNHTTSVAFSLDSKRLVSGSGNIIHIWDVGTGISVIKPLTGHTNVVTSVAFSPDGKQVVSGSNDKTICIWDAHTGSLMMDPITGHTHWVTSVAFSLDGKQVVSGSNDMTVRIWDAHTGSSVIGPLTGHIGNVTSVTFSPDGKQVVSGSDDRTIRIWNAHIGGYVMKFLARHHRGTVTSVAFSLDGKQLVSGSADSTIRIWDVYTGNLIMSPLTGHTSRVNSVAFSPDGKQVVSGSSEKTIRVWDVNAGSTIMDPLIGHATWVRSVAFSLDGTQIVSGSDDMTVRIWNAHTGNPIIEPLTGHTAWVTSVAFSPDGNQVVSGSLDQTVRIWDVHQSSPIVRILLGHTKWVMSVAFSPDGKKVVSGAWDKTIRIWDAHTGNPAMNPLKGHEHNISSVAFSPDSKKIVSGSWDMTIGIWDAHTGRPMIKPIAGHDHFVTSVAISPDGKQVASGSYNGVIHIWDTLTGSPVIKPLIFHTKTVSSVAFSPDSKKLVSGSEDKIICIWDLCTGSLMMEPLTVHTHDVTSVAFSPNGNQVVSGSRGEAICITEPLKNSQNSGMNWTFDIHTGWISTLDHELLCWIPPSKRNTAIYYPHTQLIIPPSSSIKLEFGQAHGKSWQKCRTQV